jgi:hypothetical protein
MPRLPRPYQIPQSPPAAEDQDGRITWVETINPHRGRKLRDIFNGICW